MEKTAPNSNSNPTSKNKNTPIIILLIVLIIAVIGVGAYFIIKDANKGNSPEPTQTTTTTTTNTTNTNNTSTTETATPQEIEAGITYSEIREDDFYVEAQTNGIVSGVCEISLISASSGTTYSETDELDAQNKVSICHEDFDLDKINRGEYLIRIIINAYDGRSTTLEKSVSI